jgi:hypothetical protein
MVMPETPRGRASSPHESLSNLAGLSQLAWVFDDFAIPLSGNDLILQG